MAGDPAADRQALAEVINLGLVRHCLCAITRLEVPRTTGAAGPLPLPELAAAVGADQDALRRVLRLVADHHILTLQDDQVSLTDRAGCCARSSSLAVGRLRHRRDRRRRPWADRHAADRPGGRPRVLGMDYWDYLATHPDQQALCQCPGSCAGAGPPSTGPAVEPTVDSVCWRCFSS
jgi:hypothetical protein